MNGKITLPVHGGDEAAVETLERINNCIVLTVRGDSARIVADFRSIRPVYAIEITTNDFVGLMGELENDGFL